MLKIIKKICRQLERLSADRKGGVVITFALSAVAVIGVAGMSIDGTRALNARTLLQAAADAGALAAVSDFEAPPATQTAHGKNAFNANLKSATSKITSTPSVALNGDIATVTASATIKTVMLGVMNISNVDVAVIAKARRPRNAGPACVLALDRHMDSAIHSEGSSTLSATGCVVHSNSNSDSALDTDGSTLANADDFCSVGGYEGSGFTPTPYTQCPSVQDPLEGLATPAVGPCDHNSKVFNNGTHNATPGVYCGGINFLAHADVTLAPGIYIVKDGPVSFRAHSTVAGADVLFYLTGTGAIIDMKSGSTIDITAATTGPYAGLAFFHDPNTGTGETSIIEGGGSVRIVGAVYTPSQALDIGGGGDIGQLSPFMPIIANNVNVRGNGTVAIRVDHTIVGMPDIVPQVWAGSPRLIN